MMAPQPNLTANVAKSCADLKSFALGSPLLLSCATLLFVVSFIRFLLNRPKKLDLPIVGGKSPEFKDYKSILVEGVAKYPDSPFVVQTNPSVVILPVTVINEVKNLPENKASFMKDVARRFSSKYTGIGLDTTELVKAVKTDLTKHVASTIDDLQDEIRYGFDKELGHCPEWTPIQTYAKMARIVALLSGRVFVGRPLSREEEWLEATIKYTFACTQAKDAINAWPLCLRGIVAPFLKEVKRVKAYRKRGGELVKPIAVQQMLENAGEQKEHIGHGQDDQGTFISWLLKQMPPSKWFDAFTLGEKQMSLSMAAIHTTTMATTAALYDMAAHPECIQPLRDEIEQVIATDGYDVDGKGFMNLKKSSVPKLWKLDSFLKECQRHTPPGLISNTRLATAPLTLSTGHTLPAGTRFAFASWSVQHSDRTQTFSPAYNPSVNKPVHEFDPMRFYNLRKIPGNENKHQFVTTSPDSLDFGHGNHACPGRFFASNEIKIVLIELLRSWEFRFKGDTKVEGGIQRRPQNIYGDMTVMPCTKAEMEFRRRKLIEA